MVLTFVVWFYFSVGTKNGAHPTELHQQALLEDWDLCQEKHMPKPIAPLK
jgi:hypothetical protein